MKSKVLLNLTIITSPNNLNKNFPLSGVLTNINNFSADTAAFVSHTYAVL